MLRKRRNKTAIVTLKKRRNKTVIVTLKERRNKTVIITLCAIGIIVLSLFAFFIKAMYFPVIYPIKSSSGELSVVLYSGFHTNRPVITLRHYIDGLHIADYELTIEKGVRVQEPQKYTLPSFEEGAVDVIIKLGDDYKSNFAISYNHASDLYKRGLLIYLTSDNSFISYEPREYIYDRYIYFVSGDSRMCYSLKVNALEWELIDKHIDSTPKLKKIPRNEDPYLVTYSGWKEYEWIVTFADGSS